MTRIELAKITKIHPVDINDAFRKAAEISESIKNKNFFHGSFHKVMDYTLEECLLVLNCTEKKISEIQKEIVKENFIDHGGSVYEVNVKSWLMDGQKEFDEKTKKGKCCQTCCYLIGKTVNGHGNTAYPFCEFYNRYISYRNDINIFKDYCKTYTYKSPPYRVWLIHGAPQTAVMPLLKPSEKLY